MRCSWLWAEHNLSKLLAIELVFLIPLRNEIQNPIQTLMLTGQSWRILMLLWLVPDFIMPISAECCLIGFYVF